MRRRLLLLLVLLAILGGGLTKALYRLLNKSSRRDLETVEGEERVFMEEGIVCLPFPRLDGEISLERALRARRSVREYEDAPITLKELSQILWSAYGVTETRWSLKTTPSAGGTYPLDVYVVISPKGVVSEEGAFLAPGSYIYDYRSHCVRLVKEGDLSEALCEAALGQEWVREAPVKIVLVGVFERTTRRYGNRGVRYVWLEAGHASQNIYLQATALGLGTVAVGAFYDDEVKKIIEAERGEPLYIMPIGRQIKPYDITEEKLRKYYEENRGRAAGSS